MDILGPLPRTDKGNQWVLVIKNRFSKLTRTIPLKQTTAPTIAQAFIDMWVMPYGMTNYVLTDNGSQFVSKFFAAV